MAEIIMGNTIGEVWDSLLDALIVDGKVRSPRGFATKELLNVTICVHEALNNIFVNPKRNLNYKFMVAEWLWITAGLNDVNILAKYNSQMKKFSDDGLILSGAYGPRLMPQMPYILETLSKPDSRQAVATIWTPSPPNSMDIPCTISLQWILRDDQLHGTVNMRSSDVWLGLPYDYFTFSQITNYVASRVGCSVGSLTMNLASSHIYEPQWAIASEMSNDDSENLSSPKIPLLGTLPAPFAIRTILNNPRFRFDDPFWTPYSDVLTGNIIQALEVLRGISPTRSNAVLSGDVRLSSKT